MSTDPRPSGAASLRRAHIEFLGDDQFLKFVSQLRQTGHLRYWQEEAWGRFTIAHPDHRVSLTDLHTALRICELHGDELLPDTVEVVEGCVDYSERYTRAKRDHFPNAASGPIYTEGAPHSGRVVDVWYCPECRRAEAPWRGERARQGCPSEMDLRRQTTLNEYGSALGCDAFTGWRRDKWLSFRSEVEAMLADGGQLWEWESVGFRSFAGEWGLAVVRDGKVVKHWQLAKS